MHNLFSIGSYGRQNIVRETPPSLDERGRILENRISNIVA
jgi:hypothetical protein